MVIQMWGDWWHVRKGGLLREFLMRISRIRLGDESKKRVVTGFWPD